MNIGTSDPSLLKLDRNCARQALGGISAAGHDTDAVIRDQFNSMSSALASPDSKLLASIASSAARASGDQKASMAMYRAAIEQIASGSITGAAPIAGLILTCMEQGFNNGKTENKTDIARAALSTVSEETPDPNIQHCADLILRVQSGNYYTESSVKGIEAALNALHCGRFMPSSLLQSVLKPFSGRDGADGQQSLLKTAASAMISEGIEGSSNNDKRHMASEAVRFMASKDGGEIPLFQMTADVLDGMHFSTTSYEVALKALEQKGDAGTDVLAGTALAMMEKAFAGTNDGKWVDEKTMVATRCLSFIASKSDNLRIREAAALGADMVKSCTFTKSGVAVGELAFNLLASGREPGDADIAAFTLNAMDKALATDSASGHYQDDKSGVARLAADWFCRNGSSEDTGKWGELLKSALEPAKFTTSNVAVAKAGLEAVIEGHRADSTAMAACADAMVEGARNTESASGKFQADKSTVLNAVMPLMQKIFQGPEVRILELYEKAGDSIVFASSREKLGHTALRALQKGKCQDRDLAAMAHEFSKGATTGEDSSYAYRDDKTGVALRSARYLEQTATDSDIRYLSNLMLKALDRTSFSETTKKISDLAFQAMEDGAKGGRDTAIRLGRQMVQKALASTTTSGKWTDDKTRVAYNLLEQIGSETTDAMATTVIKLTKSAMDACHFSNSTAAIADAGFKTLAGSSITKKEIAAAARAALDGAAVDMNKQDKGPVAVSIFRTLSTAGMGCRDSAVPLEMVSAMMDTGADYTERVKAAEKAISLWSASDTAGITDISRYITDVASASKDAKSRYTMLANAVPVLARSRGPQAEGEAADRLKLIAASETHEDACKQLTTFIQELAAQNPAAQEVENMIKALEPEKDAAKSIVEDDDFINVGGVRLKKRQE